MDGVAVGRDAANEAVEKDDFDVEGDLYQFEHQPDDGREVVASVALCADDAAALFDFGDLPDGLCGLVRAGNLLRREIAGCFQGGGELPDCKGVAGDVDFVAVVNHHVDGVNRDEKQ